MVTVKVTIDREPNQCRNIDNAVNGRPNQPLHNDQWDVGRLVLNCNQYALKQCDNNCNLRSTFQIANVHCNRHGQLNHSLQFVCGVTRNILAQEFNHKCNPKELAMKKLLCTNISQSNGQSHNMPTQCFL